MEDIFILLGTVYSNIHTKAGHVPRMGDIRNDCKILVKTPEMNRRFVRPRGSWKNNIKAEVGCLLGFCAL
jgi:hypothetical protein